jgi:hypothetical protein
MTIGSYDSSSYPLENTPPPPPLMANILLLLLPPPPPRPPPSLQAIKHHHYQKTQTSSKIRAPAAGAEQPMRLGAVERPKIHAREPERRAVRVENGRYGVAAAFTACHTADGGGERSRKLFQSGCLRRRNVDALAEHRVPRPEGGDDCRRRVIHKYHTQPSGLVCGVWGGASFGPWGTC